MNKTPQVCLFALLALAAPAAMGQSLTLWAVDESGPVVNGTRQSPHLVVFTDYTSASSSAISYGRLMWDDNGVIREFAGGSSTNAEAMALDSRTGQAWIIVNPASGGFAEANLFTVDLSTLEPGTQVVLAHIGPIIGYTKVEALAYDEISGQLYAVAADQSGGNAEDFISISKTTAAPVFIGDLTGVIGGASESVDQTDGLEIVHTYNAAGLPISRVFYAFDQVDRELYTVNPATGALLAVINNAPGSGTDIEALAWDYTSSRMLAMNNGNNNIMQLSLVGNTAAVLSTYNDQDVYGGADFEGAAVYSRPLSGLSIGNLVFADDNRNGVFDPGAESGIAGVEVQLWRSDPGGEVQVFAGPDGDPYQALDNASPLLTSANGTYHFKNLLPGTYRIKIAAASFDPGQPLDGWQSSSLAAAGDDNAGQDGFLNGTDGAMSGLITLAVDSEPANSGSGSLAESGAFNTMDDSDDNNGDMTVDFGFHLQADDHGDFSGFADASSIASSALRLGAAATDTEQTAATDSAATGDDLSGADDEDGASFATVVQGQNASVTITLANSTASSAYLNAWIDFNGNGSLADPGEQIIANVTIASGSTGSQVYPFAVPADSATGGLGARLRLTSTSSPGPVGLAGSGEVEDMLVTVEPANIIGIGNLVFLDTNGNGHADASEGVDGVTVQLYTSAQITGTDTPLNSVVTSSGGKYLLPEVLPGSYRLHIPAAMFASGAPLHSAISISEGLSGDDDVGEDGVNSADPSVTGISSGIVTLHYGTAPTDLNGESGTDAASDNDYDASIDLTIDFGFANPLGVGNLVFIDANTNGHFDSGEGVAGVAVQLFRAGDDPATVSPLASATTDASGHYLFDYLAGGSYFIRIPPAMFAAGAPLNGKVSISGAGAAVADDGTDENGLDDPSPNVRGIRTADFALANDAEPTDAAGENGYLAAEDARDDDNYNLTIDLGFRAPDPDAVGAGNLVFHDANGNGRPDDGEGVDGVTARLFAAGANPLADPPVATTATAGGGFYLFSSLAPGSYFIHIPPAMFASGAPLHRMLSQPGQGGDFPFDDDQDENGDDPADPLVAGVRSADFALAPDSEPTSANGEDGAGAFADDIDDNNTDLTIDFAFYRPVGLGNLVYVDANHSGGFDAGEGFDGVTVELFLDTQSPGFSPPLASTVTAGGGFYLFSDLPPDGYLVHIPTSQFLSGGPLAAFSPLPGQGADNGTDDDLDENGSDPANPWADGVTSLPVALASGTEPADQAGETGQGASADNTEDTDTDLTVDFGFTLRSPNTFAQWQAQNPLGGQNGPNDDPDGDGITNAGEYALGEPPGSGVLAIPAFELVLNPATQTIDARARRLPVLNDATLVLEGIADLASSPGGWFDVGIGPVVLSTDNGVQTIAFENLEQVPAFAGGSGFARLRVSLDLDLDSVPDAVYRTEAWAWSRQSFQPALATSSNPLGKAPVFSGIIGSVSGSALDLAAAVGSGDLTSVMSGAAPWHIEVLSGEHEGHRFEVDEAASVAATLVLDAASPLNTLPAVPATLAGARILLRQHRLMAEDFPPAAFRSTNSQSTADRLLFFNGASFYSYWLFANSGAPKWVNDASLADRGGRVIHPAEALLAHPRSNPASVLRLGIVRASKFACPLPQGTALIAGGWPMEQSPASRGMNAAAGFKGANSASSADRIQIWKGDLTPGASGYESHYLLKSGAIERWVRVGDTTLADEMHLPLFKSMQGAYVISVLGLPAYVMPRPWTP